MQVTVTDAAKRFGVNPATIRKMCREERVPSVNMPDIHHRKSGIWFVDTDDLEAYWKRRAERFQCKPLTEVEKAYMAGFLDGEGCFTAFITKRRCKNKTRIYEYTSILYFIQILVVEEEPIRWLKEVTGQGYLFQRKRREKRYQDLWGWRVSNAPACEVIEQIFPYLKIKRRQAEIFLALRDRIASMKDHRKGKTNDSPMPREEWIERQKLIDEIHHLNKPNGRVLRKEFSVEAT